MFTEDDFVTDLGHNHSVEFCLYIRDNKRKTALPSSKELKKVWSKDYKKQICYRELVSGFKKHSANSIVSVFKHCKISKDKATQWLTLAKNNGYLPKYINIKSTIKEGKLAFNLNKHTQNEWYVFLSITRFLQAEPQVVLNALVMLNKGLNFDTALLIASKMQLDNSNHHFIPGNWCHSYLTTVKSVLEEDIPTAQVTALRVFIDNMHNMQTKYKHFTGFTCNDHIENIFNKSTKNVKKLPTFKLKEYLIP